MSRAASLGWTSSTVVVSVVYWVLGVLAPPPALHSVSDDLLHAAAYLLLGFLAAQAAGGWLGRHQGILGACFAVGHGAVLEGLQLLNPARMAELSDLLADAAGACGGALLAQVSPGRRQ